MSPYSLAITDLASVSLEERLSEPTFLAVVPSNETPRPLCLELRGEQPQRC